MRFLCDEMLARLARLLRAAGHDTLLAAGQTDDDLLAVAEADDRILLTRDKALAARAGSRGRLVAGQDVMAEAAGLEVDWRAAPFTRCVVDNTYLIDSSEADIARMPESARTLPGPFRTCPACGRLYWPGSHVRRMAEQLSTLSSC